MKRMHRLRVALAASVCLIPLQAFAQSTDDFNVDEKPADAMAKGPVSDNYITIGPRYQSSGSYYTGRYSGFINPGFSLFSDFHYLNRDAWDSGGTNYFEATGLNLGSQARSIDLRVGQQGTWGLRFDYQGIPYYAMSGFQSVWQGTGQLVGGVKPASLSVAYVQVLPQKGIVNSLWIPKATNPPSLKSSNLSTQRDVFKLDGKYQTGDWTITSGWRHEHKEGFQSSSLEIGGAPGVTTAGTGATKPTGFTSGLGYFAQPIDYDTNRFDIAALFSTPKLQAQIGYTFSQFTDNLTSFNAQNPFNFFSPTLSAAYPQGTAGVRGIYTLPPSNAAHQIKAMLGYSFTPTTRLNANFGTSMMMQNDNYISGTGVSSNNSQALPRSSFDGQVRTYFGNLALTAQPLQNLDLRAAYTLDYRDNSSPMNSYDGYSTSTANTHEIYKNLPYSNRKQSGSLEAGYRLAPQTKIILNDTLSNVHRNFTDTSVVTTNLISAKIRGPVLDDLYGTFSVAHEDRWAQNYSAQGWWKAACNSCVVEPSNLLMFYEASRTHNEIKTTLDFTPTEGVTASLIARGAKDNYPTGSIGLRNNYNASIGPDVAWKVSESLNVHAYYTYQQIYYNQSSIYQSPGAPAIPAPTATNTQYSVPYNTRSTDSVNTVGVNLDWQAIPDKLKLSFDYNLSYGATAYALGEGMVAYGGAITSPTFQPSITIQSLPDVKSMLSVVSAHGEYNLTPQVTILFGAAWERFNYKDFMTTTSSTQYANALMPGSYSPNESILVASAALRLKF